MKVRSTTQIAGGPEPIWDVLTDAAEYPSLEPLVSAIHGSIEIYGRLTVVSNFPEGRNRRMAGWVTVTEFVPCSRMVWSANQLFGLIVARRVVELRPHGSRGFTEVTVTEEYQRLLAWMLADQREQIQQGLDTLTANVKRRVEGARPGDGTRG